MTRELFLKDLNNALAGLGGEEVESILAYYSEMIDDRMEAGMTEEDAVNAMEPVETIASRVLSEAEGEEKAEAAPEEKAPEKNDPEKEIRRNAGVQQSAHRLRQRRGFRRHTLRLPHKEKGVLCYFAGCRCAQF